MFILAGLFRSRLLNSQKVCQVRSVAYVILVSFATKIVIWLYREYSYWGGDMRGIARYGFTVIIN